MGTTRASPAGGHEPGVYEVRVKGRLESRWADWFADMAFVHETDGTTTLRGPLADQAALHGVIATLRDLGRPIISVQCLGPAGQGASS
jgi:hypothetical protein